ncbi:kinase-like domain-containing protein [Armillaria novae-zelandiae]|uniref:non-specific serine/threonine protein kinase n=1 Tax=Armillaria novae-zelandiae TaxID=153914 RepID=A0AA39UC28_9AGAR|nr:kinase-like domain-containing protein [Armillaria novae-zelandiae]
MYCWENRQSQSFIPSRLDEVEDVEEYRPGGFHPMSIGDVFADGRYRVIHKLGFGGSSTIWLALDRHKQLDRLVTLKAMRADVSSKAPNELSDLAVPQMLQADPHCSSCVPQAVEDHFVVEGPNGSHRFLVYPFTGPKCSSLSGSRRLRGDLARSVAKQTATAVHHMHCAGFVHGDITTSNILFHVSERILEWSDAEVYAHFGRPETEEVRTRDGHPRGPHAPPELIGTVESSRLTGASIFQENVVVVDFGQSYAVVSPRKDYEPATVINYQSLEARFEGRAGLDADVWALGCAIFEIRAGFPLFDSFFGSDTDILRQSFETLGRLPDPWWGSFQERALWFEENGQVKSLQAQELAGAFLQASKSSVRDKLRSIGTQDDSPSSDEGPMIEKSGVRLPEEEVALLGDLLERMLVYRPEDRIGIQEVIDHPWFSL